ncbi:MAG TPA: ATP-binding protein [Geobacteraceae bacterium]|nr:ATP-binding protein [Geobacteraceae bacterium]
MDLELELQLKRVLTSIEKLLPKPVPQVDWASVKAAVWRRHAMSGHLEGVDGGAVVELDDLLGIDRQKEVVVENTRQFLAGYPANNILLWGTRGTGKSSLVKAILNSYSNLGLRLVQVDKNDLVNLPDIVDEIRGEPYRFIIFADDVSFETGESSYKMLKSALDGSVYAPPENVLIYVTSNRRHLLPEYESDNRGAMLVNNEIHHGESVEEKISLSGRFGLWVGFHPFTQDQYVDVTRQWTEKVAKLNGFAFVWTRDVAKEAIDWSHAKGDRSGRIAWQFANQWVGRAMLRSQK